jgi:mono/diheme cytochrome c family protein
MPRQSGTVIAVMVGLAGVLALASTTVAADGAALWEKNCASCHGADGKGDTKAGKLTKVKDFTTADVSSTLNRDHVRQTIEQGVVDKDTGKSRMKGFKDKFSAEEIDALATHVLSLVGAK